MRLGDYLTEDRILIDVPGADMESVLRNVAERIGGRDGMPSITRLEEALLARERSQTTSLGGGIAVPHATFEEAAAPCLCVATLETPIEGPSGDLVKLLFVLVSPPGHEGEHVRLLARICRLGRRKSFLTALVEATSASELKTSLIGEEDERG